MDKRLYPLDRKTFNNWVLPVIEESYIWKGRPPIISHYRVFCAILYVLRTGIPWRDLPSVFGNWHSVYMRFQRGNEKYLWWKILHALQSQRKLTMDVVICDSSTFKYHRHGGWAKRGQQSKGRSISGLTTKLHIAITPDFRIVEGFLTGGNKADISFADELSADIYHFNIIEDKGYDSNRHRQNLLSNNNIPVIPGRSIG